ncbi:DMT family transporter [Haloarcula laminariae]|uniref:DMT family transporter n=1 Tax=Haloarcula laminariae TaxID=2961577 RepID=UPI0021C8F2B5|nr:DMT family transporter [Halomicroarcula laminariae]
MAVDLLGAGLAALATVGLAGQSIAVRQAAKERSITDLVAVVFVVNLLVLLPATAVLSYPDFGLTPRAVAAFAVAGLLGSLLARAALFVGIHRLGASRAEPLKSTFPLVAVGSAVLVLGEPLTPLLVVGVGLLVAGAAAVSGDARASVATASGADIAFPLAAALLLGIDPVFTKVGFAEGTPPLVGVTVRVLAAAGGFAGYLLWRRLRGRGYRPARPTRAALLAGVANTVYLSAYLAALSRVSVSLVAPVLGASPLLVLLGSLVLTPDDEQVTPRLGAAVAVLVAGVVLVLQA